MISPVVDHPEGMPDAVLGATVSILTRAVLVVSTLPARSVAQYSIVLVP